jgi:hypothetical protein
MKSPIPEMRNTGATFSDDTKYRYHLWRIWGSASRSQHLVFIGLNPSTADQVENDVTITKCVGFARAQAADGIHMFNLYGFRTAYPRELLEVDSPVHHPCGYDPNTNVIAYYANRCRRVVVCWGAVSQAWQKKMRMQERIHEVLSCINHKNIFCLGRTKDGSPRHPSRLAYSTPFEPYHVDT